MIEEPELEAQFDKAQAVVQQAKAALEVAKRQLAGMQADLALQQVTLKRQKELFAGKACNGPDARRDAGQGTRIERQRGDRESEDHVGRGRSRGRQSRSGKAPSAAAI